MERTRRSYLAAACGAVTAAAAGCSGIGGGGAGESLEPGAESPSLLLNWRPSGLHVPYYAALERGFYEEEGVKLGGIESGQGSDFSATQAALENVEFGVTSSDQVLNVASKGLTPICVGVIMQRGPVVLFTERDEFGEELTDPGQLTGATLGSGPGMVRMLSMAYLESVGLAGDVEVVDAGTDTVQQLLTGEIDVAAGVFGDVVDARHQGATIDTLSVADEVPSYGHVIATNQSFAEEYPDTLRAFLRGTARGAAWASTEVEAAIDLLVESEPELEEARANQRDKWDTFQAEYLVSDSAREHGWGWNDGDVWRTMADVLSERDFLESEVDSDAVWTNEYLDQDYRYIGDFTGEADG